MSPYERGRNGNAFREGARRLPHQGNADMGQRGSGHLAVTGSVNWETGMSHHKDQPAKQTGNGGVYVCQHLSFTAVGKGLQRNAKVRTESGKSRCSGSQGGLRKREHDGSRTEVQRETAGVTHRTLRCTRAALLSRPIDDASLRSQVSSKPDAAIVWDESARCLMTGRVTTGVERA
jgi:hypothetical protein